MTKPTVSKHWKNPLVVEIRLESRQNHSTMFWIGLMNDIVTVSVWQYTYSYEPMRAANKYEAKELKTLKSVVKHAKVNWWVHNNTCTPVCAFTRFADNITTNNVSVGNCVKSALAENVNSRHGYKVFPKSVDYLALAEGIHARLSLRL